MLAGSTTMGRLQELNNRFDAFLAEQASRRHRFHVPRSKAAPPSTWRDRPAPHCQEAEMTEPPALRMLAMDAIAAGNGLRHEFREEELAELAQSIRDKGILQPLLVRPHGDAFELVAGARRWRAAQRAGVPEIPVIVRFVDDAEALELALVENLQREDLAPLEEAEAYRRLLELRGCTQENLSAGIGKSRSHVANTLRLLSLPEPVRRRLEAGEISAGHARALLAAPDPAVIAAEVVRRGLNVRETERLMQRRAKAAPRLRHFDGDTLALERDLGACLGLPVSITPKRPGGVLAIRFQTFDQLASVAALLRRASAGISAAA
jgi:ParB family chromosome partitioning protein